MCSGYLNPEYFRIKGSKSNFYLHLFLGYFRHFQRAFLSFSIRGWVHVGIDMVQEHLPCFTSNRPSFLSPILNFETED